MSVAVFMHKHANSNQLAWVHNARPYVLLWIPNFQTCGVKASLFCYVFECMQMHGH